MGPIDPLDPNFRGFAVRHQAFRNFGRFENAVASFGPFPDSNLMDVSVDLFDIAKKSDRYFHMLECFKGPNVFRGFLVNDREVLIDRVRGDFRSWLDRSYHEFASQPLPDLAGVGLDLAELRLLKEGRCYY
ncbi:hypothetical protein RHSIM_Rhsim08G0095600 [Rhododendron simsii]|uniref:Uncharacterized protein n=1 Tax=Rhododendron simsii TaxID=118357 RepID=A0A834GPV8_RHOSS|nr:hypothetical protein RHSIM_Rhsim08G0095600 [Rhododendron simsii]